MRDSPLRLLKCFQHLFGSCAYRDVFGEIYPANYSARINEKLCRASDVRAFWACAAMQKIVVANDFCLGIGQERVSVAELLALAPIDVRCVHANRDDLNPTRFKFRKLLLKTPQLGVTEWSPETAIKNQRNGFGSADEILKRHILPILV